ncbi:MAG TPA: hypothetical protein VI775_01670 [Candidatus Paceibacterota bacterium]
MKKKGLILINVLVFSVIAITVTTALINWAAALLKQTRQIDASEQAFQIAEAGIDYYRWHLAHEPTDYTDGFATTSTGPFIHDFEDKSSNVIGQFALTITPPPIGSTVVKIKSKGTVITYPDISRTISVTLAIPSLAKYSVAANDFMRFGAGTEVFGPVHSNGGIRFDGVTHNIMTSAVDKFIDPDTGGPYRFGVYTTDSPTDPSPPSAVPDRSDIFMAGRQFPVPAFDFIGMTTDLSSMKADAQAGGSYYPSSGKEGYHIVLKTNDTFDIYKVNSMTNPSNGCKTDGSFQDNWDSWTINNQSSLGNHPIPVNGVIFVEDHVWVDGHIDTARVTIAAGRFPDNPSTRKSIIINNDLLYTNYDGQDSIALVAQGDISTGLSSENDLRIDAAVIAQNGRVGRFYYSWRCGVGYERDTITLFGMIASNLRYGFAYTNGTGYNIRNIIYDQNLLYSPPPSFPLTSDQYTTISWDEIK